MKTKILFCKELSETKSTIDCMTLDDLYWMFEQITIKEQIEKAYQYDMERLNSQQQ